MQRGEEEIVELVNVVVDGQATEAQRAELEALLQTSNETRVLYDDVRDVARRLNEMERIAPPAELRPAVLWQIRRKQPAPATRRRIVFGVGWAAAAAFLLAVLLFDPFGFRHPSDTVATMAPQWPVIAEFPHLLVRQNGDLYALEPRIPGRVSISLDHSLTPVGISGGIDVSFGKVTTTFTLRPSERAALIVRRKGDGGSAEVRMRVGHQLFTSRFVLTDIEGQQHQQLR